CEMCIRDRDLRGHGYTDAPNEAAGAQYSVPELVDDITAALEQLQVPQQFILVCHSFGGALSSYFIQQFPERVSALIIIASAVHFRLRPLGRALLRMPPPVMGVLRKLAPYFGIKATHVYPLPHVVYLQNKNALRPWDGTQYLRAIHAPTLVILGQRDILFNQSAYKEVARLIPNAEEIVIPVSAHQVMVERPDAVNRAIERFLLGLSDPAEQIERRNLAKIERRVARKKLELERPWLKHYDARTPYHIKMPTMPLSRLLEATARRFSKTTALSYYGAKLSWRELDQQANRFAHGLIRMRIKPGERVMLALPNMPQTVIAYFGVLKAGAIAVMTDAATSKEVLLTRIAESQSVLLIVTSMRYQELKQDLRTDPRVAGLRRVVFAALIDYMGWREKIKFGLLHHVQDGHGLPWMLQDSQYHKRYARFNQVLGRGRNQPPDVPQHVDDIAVIVYTFGATGTPLPVPLSHKNLAANALQLRHWLPESRPGDERFLAQQPFSTAYGLTGLLHLGAYLGATLILLPNAELLPLLKTIKKYRPTYFPTTPHMVRLLAYSAGVRQYGLASIRVCAVSGSPLPLEIREEFEKITRGRLIEAYGLSEASPAVLAMPLTVRQQSGVIGLPLPDTEVKIIDFDSGNVVASDMLGELWVRGPQVFIGYDDNGQLLRSRKANEERLRDGWLATGDIASIDDEGYVSIIDRKDNMLLRCGERVFPRQIEDVLFEHPAVALAEVKAVPD
ncbi:MAG: alpha/beta fold hydrolase, partial [Glaciimonas sp.]|nr:alpha/beta fold hydrolase [Glaciimonas sp.]